MIKLHYNKAMVVILSSCCRLIFLIWGVSHLILTFLLYKFLRANPSTLKAHECLRQTREFVHENAKEKSLLLMCFKNIIPGIHTSSVSHTHTDTHTPHMLSSRIHGQRENYLAPLRGLGDLHLQYPLSHSPELVTKV